MHIELVDGGDDTIFDSMAPDEWVMLDPFCAEPGQTVDMFVNVSTNRFVAITDPAGGP